jgi:hypothetical protein
VACAFSGFVRACYVRVWSALVKSMDDLQTVSATTVPASQLENVGDCGTEGRKGGGKERKKRRKRAEKSGTCYFDASPFFLRNTQNVGISDYS